MDELGRRLAECTLGLCRIPSVTGSEAALADELEARCRAIAPERTRRLGNALLCQGPRRAGRPTVALLGHTDTVAPSADQPTCIRQGRVYGCGASDMKGGLAVMLELLARAGELPRNLVCVFYDREEGPVDDSGLEPLLAQGLLREVDLALCLEPTDNRIQSGCLGGLHAHIIFRGRRAHSARPWQGQSALSAALPFLTQLAGRERREVRVGGLPFYEVMIATTAHTDNPRNVVPDRFVINVNYRFAPGRELAEAEAELRAQVPQEAEVAIVDRAPAGPVCHDHPLLRPWREALGIPVEPKQAWTDVARLGRHGVPAVNFGPGETAQAHQARESIPIENLVTHYQALLRLLFP